MTVGKTFGDELKDLSINYDSNKEFAKKLGVSIRTLYYWYKREKKPNSKLYKETTRTISNMKYYWKKKREKKLLKDIRGILKEEGEEGSGIVEKRQLTFFDFKDQIKAGFFDSKGKAIIFLSWHVYDGKEYENFSGNLIIDFRDSQGAIDDLDTYYWNNIYEEEDAGNLEIYVNRIIFLPL